MNSQRASVHAQKLHARTSKHGFTSLLFYLSFIHHIEGKIPFMVARQGGGGYRRGKEGTQIKKNRLSRNVMSVDHFCGSRKLSSAMREKGGDGRGGGLEITDTAPCNSKFTIIAINVVKNYSYEYKDRSQKHLNTISATIVVTDSLAASFGANRCLLASVFQQHRSQCNLQCDAAHQQHAFNSMVLTNNNNKKGLKGNVAHMYSGRPLLNWPVLVWSSACKVTDRPLFSNRL